MVEYIAEREDIVVSASKVGARPERLVTKVKSEDECRADAAVDRAVADDREQVDVLEVAEPDLEAQEEADEEEEEEEDEEDWIEKNAIVAVSGLLSAATLKSFREQNKDEENPPQEPVLSVKATTLLYDISGKMNEPTKNLADLLAAINPPEDGEFTRAYMIRRKNACGATHLLTAEKGKQRIQICWTKGVLESLKSVMEDSMGQEIEEFLPNDQTRDEYKDARRRAVATLMNLAAAQENRLVLLHYPNLIPALLSTISSSPECSKGGAATLAHLSKTKENRLFLAKVPGLFDTVADILVPKGDDHTLEGAEDEMEAISHQYDECGGADLKGARQNMFALLFHLGKEKDNAYHMARNARFMDALAAINSYLFSDFQEYASKVLANLSRHHGNTKHITFQHPNVIQSLVTSTYSYNDESRKLSCQALQNFAHDKPCRLELSSMMIVIPALCDRIREGVDEEERLSALQSIKSLSEEPSNLIVMSNTPDCMPTLTMIADGTDETASEMMRYLASDAWANFSSHCQMLAAAGKKADDVSRGLFSEGVEPFVPSFNVTTWEQWE